MAMEPAAAPAPERADPPRFDTAAMRSSECQVVTVRAAAGGVDLHFGVLQVHADADGHAAGARQVHAAHRIALARDAAVHLEELLTRVLDRPPSAGADEAGTVRPGAP